MVTRRLFFAELVDRAVESGAGLLGHRFRTVEELEELPLEVALEIVPARNPSCRWRQMGAVLWEVRDAEPPRRVMELSQTAQAVLSACDRCQRLEELQTVGAEADDDEARGRTGEDVWTTFIGLVRAGVVVPAKLPSR